MNRVITNMSLIEKEVERMLALEQALAAMQSSFAVMNYYGSEEYFKQWGRLDGQTVLMEIYYILAVPFSQVKRALN